MCDTNQTTESSSYLKCHFNNKNSTNASDTNRTISLIKTVILVTYLLWVAMLVDWWSGGRVFQFQLKLELISGYTI